MTETEKNKLAIQYKPLVVKMTKQFFDRGLTDWNSIESMAWEGLALAMNNYDEKRSKMNFTQYAAFSIRNNILTSLDNELRTVKMSNYMQKKAVERGDTLYTSVSLDSNADDKNGESHNKEFKFNAYTKPVFADGDVFEYVYDRLEDQFNERDCMMFYKAFGLKGFEDTKGKDIAKEYGVSEGLVSQKIKKMTSWIRKDSSMCEMLQNLM
jgi:RNA polymerase sigma factor (sigma-70 family)